MDQLRSVDCYRLSPATNEINKMEYASKRGEYKRSVDEQPSLEGPNIERYDGTRNHPTAAVPLDQDEFLLGDRGKAIESP